MPKKNMSYSHCNKSLDWIQRAESMYVEYFQYSMNSASEPVGCVKIKSETLPNLGANACDAMLLFKFALYGKFL